MLPLLFTNPPLPFHCYLHIQYNIEAATVNLCCVDELHRCDSGKYWFLTEVND